MIGREIVMPYIELSKLNGSVSAVIMIFTEGTILKPKSFLGSFDHKSYIPIGDCAAKIDRWQSQGAEIVYCTSRRGRQAEQIARLLKRYGFGGTKLYYRERGQKYKDLVEQIKPQVLIEDDCKSIGGKWQMCITDVTPLLKGQIISVVVPEFKGIDALAERYTDFDCK